MTEDRRREEDVEGEEPRREVVEIDIEDIVHKEALKDVLAVNEEIPEEPDIKSPLLREFWAFKEECDNLMKLIKPYRSGHDFDILSEEFDLRKAMEIAKTIVGINGGEEVIEGEPSAYVQELYRKIWQKYIDCKWFEAMLSGKKPVTPKELKFQRAPDDLLKIEGEKI
jgi:hypothetical protein